MVQHGHATKGAQSPTYKSWQAMFQRCCNELNPDYPNYGGRGIRIEDPRWRFFENFLSDMGARPEGKTLGRRDNEKGYSKDNCCWETREEQNSNQRMRKDTPFGIPGVTKKAGSFRARAVGRNLYQGVDFFEACCARKSWEIHYG